MTIEEILALPAEDTIQHHDLVDEADARFQAGLHALAARSVVPPEGAPR